jgi:hypothetical protein
VGVSQETHVLEQRTGHLLLVQRTGRGDARTGAAQHMAERIRTCIMVGRARQFYEPALISPVHLKDGILVPPQDAPILAVVVRVPKVCSHAAGARERRRRGGEGGQRGARTVLAVIYAQTHLSLEEDARNSLDGLNLTLFTAPMWPSRIMMGACRDELRSGACDWWKGA